MYATVVSAAVTADTTVAHSPRHRDGQGTTVPPRRPEAVEGRASRHKACRHQRAGSPPPSPSRTRTRIPATDNGQHGTTRGSVNGALTRCETSAVCPPNPIDPRRTDRIVEVHCSHRGTTGRSSSASIPSPAGAPPADPPKFQRRMTGRLRVAVCERSRLRHSWDMSRPDWHCGYRAFECPQVGSPGFARRLRGLRPPEDVKGRSPHPLVNGQDGMNWLNRPIVVSQLRAVVRPEERSEREEPFHLQPGDADVIA